MDFDRNDRDGILDAIADDKSPIAEALRDRVREFTKTLLDTAERQGFWTTELLLYRPETAFDEIVIHFTLEAIADVLHRHITVRWIPRDTAA